MIHEGELPWDDKDSILVASLSLKFHMPDIERYIRVGDLKGHLRLYSRIMRAHNFMIPSWLLYFLCHSRGNIDGLRRGYVK